MKNKEQRVWSKEYRVWESRAVLSCTAQTQYLVAFPKIRQANDKKKGAFSDVGGFVTACHISLFLACKSNGEIFDLRFQAHSNSKGGLILPCDCF